MSTKFVTLTDEQRKSCEARCDRWIATLMDQARSDDDPETRDNARLLLANRGIRW